MLDDLHDTERLSSIGVIIAVDLLIFLFLTGDWIVRESYAPEPLPRTHTRARRHETSTRKPTASSMTHNVDEHMQQTVLGFPRSADPVAPLSWVARS